MNHRIELLALRSTIAAMLTKAAIFTSVRFSSFSSHFACATCMTATVLFSVQNCFFSLWVLSLLFFCCVKCYCSITNNVDRKQWYGEYCSEFESRFCSNLDRPFVLIFFWFFDVAVAVLLLCCVICVAGCCSVQLFKLCLFHGLLFMCGFDMA